MESHQDVCQVIFAVVGSVFLSLPVHRQRVVVIFRVLLLENQKISFMSHFSVIILLVILQFWCREHVYFYSKALKKKVVLCPAQNIKSAANGLISALNPVFSPLVHH